MRACRFLNVALLSMLVGCSALLFAQDNKQQEDHPARQDEPKAQPKQEEAKPPHQEPQREEARPAQPERRDEKSEHVQEQQQKDPHDQAKHDQMKPEDRQHPEQRAEQQEHPQARPEHAPAAGRGARIPDDKFRAHYGQSHTFHARTVIVSGQPRFHYADYDFEFIDAWPADWSYDDDCYIDYIDGEYFLFNVRHPGMRIAVFVVM
ncbi:MAG TPA: hypothetical protein VI386_36885 [Candidatus Sulfotelmatobacter sp.]